MFVTLGFSIVQSSLTQPQMMVVSDLDDIFIPLPDDLLVNLSESREVVETFLDSLPSMFENNMNVESAFGPALKAAFMVMVCYYFLLLCLPYQNSFNSAYSQSIYCKTFFSSCQIIHHCP